MLETLFPGVAHLQNIHPLAVHFPIAFLVAAPFLYVLAWLLHREDIATAAFVFLILGALAAISAAGTGLYAEDGVMIARSVRAHLLHQHKTYMLWTTALGIVSAAWAATESPFPKKGRWLFLVLMLATLTVLALGGDLGGRMVYDYNAGGDACSQPIEFSR